jgi:ribosomal protein L11 methyltransferase
MEEWISITIDTAHEGVDAVCARLAALGVESLSVEDAADFQAFLDTHRAAWDFVDDALFQDNVCRVGFYVPNDEEGRQTLARVREGLASLPVDCPDVPFGALAVRTNLVREEDWADNWKQYYKPIPIGRRLLIQPSWLPIENPEGRTVFLHNPGMSFGTGDHETTFLCLEALERRIAGGERLLDVGCGSGILSICALLLGAGSAHALDIDSHAVEIAYQNAESNGLSEPGFTAHQGNLLEAEGAPVSPPYDIVTANIVADVIVALCPIIKKLLKPGGLFIISGIISAHLDKVLAALEQTGFQVEESHALHDWHCITAGRAV